jgi:hypothetical protein
MGKIISIVVSGIIGIGLAIVVALGVISSATAAPSHNPASTQVVDYGTR